MTSELIASKHTHVLGGLTYSVCRGQQCPPHVPAAAGRSVDDTSGWPAPEESVHPRKHTHHKQTAITIKPFFIFYCNSHSYNGVTKQDTNDTIHAYGGRPMVLAMNWKSILTKSLAFTDAPLSQRSFTLDEQPAMTVGQEQTPHHTPASTAQ